MPSKPKSKATKPINPTSTSPSEPKPFARKDYYSSLAYHLALLFGSFLLLPRTRSSYVSRWGIASASPDDNTGWHQTTSADRPEHPWLTPITANPTRTLLWHLMGEVVIVLMWGQHLVSLSGVKRVVDKQQRVAANMSRLKEAAIATASSIPLFTVCLLLLGAPIAFRTLLLAIHASLLLVWAPAYSLGFGAHGSANRFRMKRIFSSLSTETEFEKAVLYPVIGAIAGGWLGGTLLALDWDRPWQGYPLTPVFGSLVGYTVGHLAH